VPVAGGVEPGHEPDHARRDAEIEEREVSEYRFDKRPHPVGAVAELADEVRGQEEPDDEGRGEGEPVGGRPE
jgi:hypothetical protein